MPTVAESGFAGYNVVTWNGLMAPAGTPKPIVDRIAAEIAKAIKDPKFVERLVSFGADPSGITPAAVRRADRIRPQAVGGSRRGRRRQAEIAMTQQPILIAGGGPVGFITALAIARQGLPVHVFEAEPRVMDMPRAATTHAATLEMLAGLGMVDEVIERGLVEPLFRIWDRQSKTIVAEFDFGRLKDETPYPFAVQCEQHKLAAMAIDAAARVSACHDRILRARHRRFAVRGWRRNRGRDRGRHPQGRAAAI